MSDPTDGPIIVRSPDDLNYLPPDAALRRGVTATLSIPWTFPLLPFTGIACSAVILGSLMPVGKGWRLENPMLLIGILPAVALFAWSISAMAKTESLPVAVRLHLDTTALSFQLPRKKGRLMIPWTAFAERPLGEGALCLRLRPDAAEQVVTVGHWGTDFEREVEADGTVLFRLRRARPHLAAAGLQDLIAAAVSQAPEPTAPLAAFDALPASGGFMAQADASAAKVLGRRHNQFNLWPYQRLAQPRRVEMQALPPSVRWALAPMLTELRDQGLSCTQAAVWQLPDQTRAVFHLLAHAPDGEELVHLEVFYLKAGAGQVVIEIAAESVLAAAATERLDVRAIGDWFIQPGDWRWKRVRPQAPLRKLLRPPRDEPMALAPDSALDLLGRMLQEREDWLLAQEAIRPIRRRRPTPVAQG